MTQPEPFMRLLEAAEHMIQTWHDHYPDTVEVSSAVSELSDAVEAIR